MAKKGTRKASADKAQDAQASTAPGVDAILEQLEGVVAQLEQGQLPLEDALEHFEKGVRLVRTGEQQLAGIEQRVEQLLGDDGEVAPFDVDEDGDQ